MTQFIKVGEDRIKLDTIERYGIKFGVRYLVKDADEIGVEVDGRVFDSAYTDYGASWREEEDIKTAAPIHDMNTGLPVKINREVVGYGCIPPSGFVVKKDRILYVDDSEYFASVVDFDIDEKVAELDRYFLGEEVSPSDVSPSQTQEFLFRFGLKARRGAESLLNRISELKEENKTLRKRIKDLQGKLIRLKGD